MDGHWLFQVLNELSRDGVKVDAARGRIDIAVERLTDPAAVAKRIADHNSTGWAVLTGQVVDISPGEDLQGTVLLAECADNGGASLHVRYINGAWEVRTLTPAAGGDSLLVRRTFVRLPAPGPRSAGGQQDSLIYEVEWAKDLTGVLRPSAARLLAME